MDIEPLDTDLWFTALGRLEQRLNTADESQLGQALRHAFHLQQLAPRWLRGLLRTRLDEYQFEDVLEHGNYEVAADALVGPPMTYTILQCGDELVQAAICLPGAPGESPGGHTRRLVALSADSGESLFQKPGATGTSCGYRKPADPRNGMADEQFATGPLSLTGAEDRWRHFHHRFLGVSSSLPSPISA